MLIGASQNNSGSENVLVSLPRTDIIQKKSFFHNSPPILTDDSIKSLVKLRTKLLLSDNAWSTRYNVPKKMDIVKRQQNRQCLV